MKTIPKRYSPLRRRYISKVSVHLVKINFRTIAILIVFFEVNGKKGI